MKNADWRTIDDVPEHGSDLWDTWSADYQDDEPEEFEYKLLINRQEVTRFPTEDEAIAAVLSAADTEADAWPLHGRDGVRSHLGANGGITLGANSYAVKRVVKQG